MIQESKFSRKLKIVIRFIPMLLMMVIIFVFSAQPDYASTQVSDMVVNPIFALLKSFMQNLLDGNAMGVITVIVRKSAHFLEYALFGATVCYAMKELIKDRRVLVITSEIISILYATSDEWHQSFVPGRFPSAWDVLLDGVGAVAGIFLLILIFKRIIRRTKDR